MKLDKYFHCSTEFIIRPKPRYSNSGRTKRQSQGAHNHVVPYYLGATLLVRRGVELREVLEEVQG
ncbi:hypothetical protein RintRC_1164 [Richelia intracellularis]|nr:hypothetical protein RintRC_1164 [Richelia intracellularis]